MVVVHQPPMLCAVHSFKLSAFHLDLSTKPNSYNKSWNCSEDSHSEKWLENVIFKRVVTRANVVDALLDEASPTSKKGSCQQYSHTT